MIIKKIDLCLVELSALQQKIQRILEEEEDKCIKVDTGIGALFRCSYLNECVGLLDEAKDSLVWAKK